MAQRALQLSVTRRVLTLVLTISYFLFALEIVAPFPTIAGQDWRNPQGVCKDSRGCDDSSNSSSSGYSGGRGLSNEELWDERPNLFQSLVMWPMAIMLDFVFVPLGLLQGVFTGGENFSMLDRAAAIAWNYCPLVVTARLLEPVGKAISSISLPSLSLPSLSFPSKPKPEPEPPTLSMKELALQAVQEGKLAQSRVNWSAAERAYRRAIELDPEDWESHADLARVLQMQGSLPLAERYARQAVELSPDNAKVRTTLGSILKQANNYAEAEQQFIQAVNLDPRDPMAEQALTELVKSQGGESFFKNNPYPAEMDKVKEAQALGQSQTAADQGRLIEILLGTKPDGASSGGQLTSFPSDGVSSSEAGLAPPTRNPGTAGGADPGADLKGADFHGQKALSKKTLEEMSDEARKVFDTRRENKDTLTYPQKSGQRPESSLAKNLTEQAKEDTHVKQFMLWDQQLDTLKAETAQKLTTINEQLKQGTGDAAVLNAQRGTLENQMKTYDADKVETRQRLKEYVVKDRGLKWIESATPPAETKAQGARLDTSEAKSK